MPWENGKPEDQDGDGFSDEAEETAGTDPNDPASTPMDWGPVDDAEPLSLAKLMIKLNFSAANKDLILMSGTLPIPAEYEPEGQEVMVDIGGVVKHFKLDTKGRSPRSKTASFKLKIKRKKGQTVAGNGKFLLKLKKRTFREMLADEGLANEDIGKPGADVRVPARVYFNQARYEREAGLRYLARRDKRGVAK